MRACGDSNSFIVIGGAADATAGNQRHVSNKDLLVMPSFFLMEEGDGFLVDFFGPI
jgi:hypothetical protein